MRVCAVYHNNDDDFSFTEYNLNDNKIVQVDEENAFNLVFDYYIFCGFYNSCIVRELTIPHQVKQRDIPDVVFHEFVNKLPISSVYWQYQILFTATKTQDYVVRCCAINKDVFAPLLEKLTKNKIKLDSVIFTPLMLTDNIFPEISLYGSPTLKNFKNYIQKSCCEEFNNFCSEHSLKKLTENKQLVSFAAIRYLAHSKDWLQVYNPPELLSEKMKPTRFRTLRKINVLLIIITIFFISLIAYNQYQCSNKKYYNIQGKNNLLKNKLKKLQLELGNINKKVELLESYNELNAGNMKFALPLCELTDKIPVHMWAKSLRMVNNNINLTLESTKDDVKFYSVMKDAKYYKLVNLRKRRIKGKVNYTIEVKVKTQ
ncbi:hypothetical protein AAEX28_15225 [Lentisphaerota bacterium WC36G]|nr:hypothetical protein LJT99_01995 [Lentisphaerae bacterium WC36]